MLSKTYGSLEDDKDDTLGLYSFVRYIVAGW